MKFIDQTIFGGIDVPAAQRGNCEQAATATVLGLELEDVPHFQGMDISSDDRWDARRAWLRRMGYGCLTISWAFLREHQSVTWIQQHLQYLDRAVCLVSGWSPRGEWMHAAVGEIDLATPDGWRLLHDPYPDRQGIRGEPVEVEFLFPLRFTNAPAVASA